jgi:soluble lytic murein transglycosylase
LAAGVYTGVSIRFPVRYTELVTANAGTLPPPLVYAVINVESGFRPQVMSPKGAGGLMQLTGETAEWIASLMGNTAFKPDDVLDPAVNIAIGCYFLRWLTDYYKGDTTLALCAYNAGIGNVDRWLADARYSNDGLTLASIPFRETAEYIKRVELNRRVYEARLAINGLLPG